MIESKAQRELGQALRLVTAVKQGQNERCQKIYGGLCHQFPVMMLQAGIEATLAFHGSKAAGQGDADRARAHSLLLDHAAVVLGAPQEAGAFRDHVGQRNAFQRMLDIRQLISSWVYFRRFAVSVLKVESGRDEAGA